MSATPHGPVRTAISRMFLVSALVAAPVDPKGVRWRVRIRWEPRWRTLAARLSARQRDEGSRGGSFDQRAAVLALALLGVGIAVAVALCWWVLLPLLLAVFSTVAAGAVLAVVAAGAVLVRRPWKVEAVSDTGDRFDSYTVGWRKAVRLRSTVSYFLSRGHRPEQH
jgi:hypothetical protein